MSTRRAVAYSLANDISYGPTPIEQAIPRIEALQSESADDTVLEAAVSRHLSYLYATVGRFDEARELERRAAPILEEAQVESMSWGSLGASSRTKVLLGDVAGAMDDLRAKWHAYPVEDGKTQTLAIAAAHALALLYCQEGRWEDAERTLAAFRRDDRETGTRLLAESQLAVDYGNYEEAVTLARRVVDGGERRDGLIFRAEAWLVLADAHRAAGQDQEAETATAQALSLLEQKGHLVAIDRLRDGIPIY